MLIFGSIQMFSLFLAVVRLRDVSYEITKKLFNLYILIFLLYFFIY